MSRILAQDEVMALLRGLACIDMSHELRHGPWGEADMCLLPDPVMAAFFQTGTQQTADMWSAERGS